MDLYDSSLPKQIKNNAVYVLVLHSVLTICLNEGVVL